MVLRKLIKTLSGLQASVKNNNIPAAGAGL